MVFRELTMEDFKGIEPAYNLFDSLVLVAERALQIVQEEEAAKREERKGKTPADNMLDNFVLVATRELQILEQEEKAAKREQRRGNRPVANADWDIDWSPTTTAAAQSPQSKRTRNHRGENPAAGARAQSPQSKRKRHSKGESSAAERGQSPESEKRRSKTDNGPNPPPPMPQQFKDIIREIARGRKISEETLVIQKGLYKTDVSGGHNRLSIPFNQIDQGFLTEKEKKFLSGKKDTKNNCNYYEVCIIEPCLGTDKTVNLCRWDMEKPNGKTSSSYVLNGGWNHVVKNNGLEEGIVVQLWALRIDQILYFALVKLPPRLEVEINQWKCITNCFS